MAIPNKIQAGGTATASATPTSISKVMTSTQVGTTLLMHVCSVQTGAPTFTPPAGWLLLQSADVGATSLSSRWFYYPNNPGGVTTVAVTIANSTGASITLWEFDQLDIANGVPDALASTANTSTTGPTSGNLTSATVNLLYIGVACWQADTGGAFTQTNLPNAYTAETIRTSTTGAHTISQQPYTLIPGAGMQAAAYAIKGNLGGAAPSILTLIAIRTTSSEANTIGAGGLMVPQFYQGNIGVG